MQIIQELVEILLGSDSSSIKRFGKTWSTTSDAFKNNDTLCLSAIIDPKDKTEVYPSSLEEKDSQYRGAILLCFSFPLSLGANNTLSHRSLPIKLDKASKYIGIILLCSRFAAVTPNIMPLIRLPFAAVRTPQRFFISLAYGFVI